MLLLDIKNRLGRGEGSLRKSLVFVKNVPNVPNQFARIVDKNCISLDGIYTDDEAGFFPFSDLFLFLLHRNTLFFE